MTVETEHMSGSLQAEANKINKTYPVPPWDRRPTKEIFFLNLRGRSLPMTNFKKPVTVIRAQVWLEEPHFKKANKERKV